MSVKRASNFSLKTLNKEKFPKPCLREGNYDLMQSDQWGKTHIHKKTKKKQRKSQDVLNRYPTGPLELVCSPLG